jgi:hypothetical protein
MGAYRASKKKTDTGFAANLNNKGVRVFLLTLYIRKRRPLEIEITFKQKIVCSWEQSAMHILPT